MVCLQSFIHLIDTTPGCLHAVGLTVPKIPENGDIHLPPPAPRLLAVLMSFPFVSFVYTLFWLEIVSSFWMFHLYNALFFGLRGKFEAHSVMQWACWREFILNAMH